MGSIITILVIWFIVSVPFTFFIGAIFKLGKEQPTPEKPMAMKDNKSLVAEMI